MRTIVLLLLVKILVVHSLTCSEILEFPPDKKLTLVELNSISPKDIIECLAHLGREELPPPQADFIWKTIINFYEGIENIPESVLMLLHWVTVAVTPEDYENITLSSIDVVTNFGLNYNLNEEQITAIANRIRKDYAGKEPEDYTYYDLTALRQILCAFNKTEIERIPPSAYRETAILIGKLERCSPEVMSAFATLAIQRRAFGSPNDWTAKTIKIMGKVSEYLPKHIIERFEIYKN